MKLYFDVLFELKFETFLCIHPTNPCPISEPNFSSEEIKNYELVHYVVCAPPTNAQNCDFLISLTKFS